MNILITGARGFIGKNLILKLRNGGYDIAEFDVDTKDYLLAEYCKKCDFVFHLAGINRPQSPDEYKAGNVVFTAHFLELLKTNPKKPAVMFSSSTQAEQDNPYGRSKREAEDLILEYGRETGAKTFVYRFPNVFGKWCRPNYNSAVATFCHNIANGLPIVVNDAEVMLNLVYIDDLIDEMIRALWDNESRSGAYCYVPETYEEKLGVVAETIESFARCRGELSIPNQSDPIVRKLYATYLSYLPKDKLEYPLNMHCDNRGSFTEIFRTPERGQVSVNVSKPGVIKGNHYHNTKNEKFIVVSGSGIIRLRRIDGDDVTEYSVSGEKLCVVDIPPGYTHNIENTGSTDMVTIMWVNECFDPKNSDTYSLEV